MDTNTAMPSRPRLRVLFQRGESVKYISHLDLMRLWVRAQRRAALPIAYSEGFSPHPKISFALPIPVGVSADEEVVDVEFNGPLGPEAFLTRLREQMPPGVVLLEAWLVRQEEPALPRLIRSADYTVVVETELDDDSMRESVAALLARDSIPFEKTRNGKTKRLDLRPLIEEITVVSVANGEAELQMRLVSDNTRAGRPDDVLAALGFTDPVMTARRTKLYFSQPIR